MDVKYQIFISSTYDDLQDERDQVIKAILEMGHIPVGMEMFSAADEKQWKIITRAIDQSDYYVVIVAHSYGSVTGGVSYTEKEYDYAVEKEIPVLGFLIEDRAPWPGDKHEPDPAKREGLKEFKTKVRGKPVSFWKDKAELSMKCAVALGKEINSSPRPGWVRSTEAAGPEVLSEMTRLSKENAALRKELEEYRENPSREFIEIMKRLEGNLVKLPSLTKDLNQLDFWEIFAVSISKMTTKHQASVILGKALVGRGIIMESDGTRASMDRDPKLSVERAQQHMAYLEIVIAFDSLVLPYQRFGLIEKDMSMSESQFSTEQTYSLTGKGRNFLSMLSLNQPDAAR